MAETDPIPVFSLEKATADIRHDLESRWIALLDSKQFVGGPEVGHFEAAFADFLEASGCVGVANGTDALALAIRTLGLEHGDEVIVPAFTFIATAGAVSWLGGRPVFCDVEPETLNIDLADVEAKITDRTVGVIGVHLYGRPFAGPELEALCERRGLWMIEDAAQAHGARLGGVRVGSFGDLATWSFYPSKNLGCFGDGGAVTGGSPKLLDRVRKLANHGRAQHYFHDAVGINSRLDSLQAAVLNARLPRLEENNARRREIAAFFNRRFAGIGDLRLLTDPADSEPVYHQYSILLEERDALQQHLAARQIGSAVHYPHGLHQQPAFAGLAPGDCPVSTRAAETVLCLPVFPELADVEVERVAEAVVEFFKG